MATVLSDYNCIGQARFLFSIVQRPDYADLFEITLKIFSDVGLPHDADDETVWKFCQENDCFLLTGNRSGDDGEESLEAVIRRNYSEDVLPVLTIGNLDRIMNDKAYRENCAGHLVGIISDTIEDNKYRGVPRIYLAS